MIGTCGVKVGAPLLTTHTRTLKMQLKNWGHIPAIGKLNTFETAHTFTTSWCEYVCVCLCKRLFYRACVCMLLLLVYLCFWVPTCSHIGLCCWHPSACPLVTHQPRSSSISDTHILGGVWAGRGREGQKMWVYVCVNVGVREQQWGRKNERRRGPGQAALTLRCLRPRRATDPVSNSPLLAPLMPATTSRHTICSGDCPTLLSPTPTHTIIWPGLCVVISILLITTYRPTVYLLTPRGTMCNIN